MPFQLNPDPQTLGITAPYLGRWFTNQLQLPAPKAGDTLGLALTTLQGNDWRPPAAGFFSLFIGDPTVPPAPLARLRDAKGNHPFTAGQVVALFTLMPEVEARLRDLFRQIPALTGGTQTPPAANPTRLTVRSFALALPAASNDISTIFAMLPDLPTPPPFKDDTERAHYIGLELTAPTAKTLRNGDPAQRAADTLPPPLAPMTQLRRPGKFTGPGGVLPAREDIILTGLPANATLWAFDSRGRALDPGAVAAWFSYLVVQSQSTSSPTNALALGGTGDWPQASGQPRVCLFDDARVIHVVDAHEGPLAAPFIGDRLQLGGSAVSDSIVLAGSSTASFTFTAAPTTPPGNPAYNPAVDNAPEKRMALLPDGAYDATLSLWPDGNAVATGLERDFARVAALDVEQHLVGLSRADSSTVPTDPSARRQADQNRPSTRTKVQPSTLANTDDVLLFSIAEPVANQVIEAFSTGTAGRLVVGVADGQGGPLEVALASIPAATASLPADLPSTMAESQADPPTDGTYLVRSLTNCHAVDPNTHDVTGQQVLLELKVPAKLAGAWVRAWPLGFNFDRGEHFRLDGGGGLVAADGSARLVMQLADLVTTGPSFLPTAVPSFDLMIIARDANNVLQRRIYGDCRYHRPPPVPALPTAPGPLPDTIGTNTWFLCEAGKTGAAADLTNVVTPGSTLVVKTPTDFTLLARSKIAKTALVSKTLIGTLTNSAMVTITQPAFKPTPDRIDDRGLLLPSSTAGSPPAITAPGVTAKIDRAGRPGRGGSRPAPSVPYATQERLDVCASWTETNDQHAVVGAADLLERGHELLPHKEGHPGSPAGVEIHGTGVRLQGPAAVLAKEYVLDRTAGLGVDIPDDLKSMSDIWVRSEPALAIDAAEASFTAQTPTGKGPWVAVLKTNAVGMEGLPGAGALAKSSNFYPLSVDASRVTAWLNSLSIPGINNIGDIVQREIGTASDQVLRALDRRIKTAAEGVRETAFSLKAAFQRAQDFIYLETPSLGDRGHGPTNDRLELFTILKDQLTAKQGLQVVICLAAQLAPSAPRGLFDVRDDEILNLVKQLREAAPGRVATFCPGAGAGRSLRLASTTVIVDDAYVVTGSTHLSRRGLTFDSSFAVALFDERLTDGRPQEIRRFRRALLAGRLGLNENQVPDDPVELVRSLRDFDRAGSARLAFHVIRPPAPLAPGVPYPTDGDRAVWNPDGSIATVTFNDLVVFFGLASAGNSPAGIVNDPL